MRVGTCTRRALAADRRYADAGTYAPIHMVRVRMSAAGSARVVAVALGMTLGATGCGNGSGTRANATNVPAARATTRLTEP